MDEFIKSQNGTLDDGDGRRRVFQNISQQLNATLKLQAQDKKSIFPQDLKTVASFVKVVAE